MKKPGKLRKEQLQHPNDSTYVAWNGDVRKKPSKDRWNGGSDFEDRGFHSRGVTSSSSNYTPTSREIVNGQIVFVDPKSKEVTGRGLKSPPKSLIVGGHERGRHVPERNLPEHYSPLGPRPAGAPPTSDLTIRETGTDGHAR